MDDGDKAKSWAETHDADAMDAWRRRQPQGPGREECVDCGEEIPAARRQRVPGCIRCVECQTVFEMEHGRL